MAKYIITKEFKPYLGRVRYYAWNEKKEILGSGDTLEECEEELRKNIKLVTPEEAVKELEI